MILRPAILPAMILTIKTPQAAGVLRPCRLGAAVRNAKRTEPIPPDATPDFGCLHTSIPNSEENVERLARKIETADERLPAVLPAAGLRQAGAPAQAGRKNFIRVHRRTKK